MFLWINCGLFIFVAHLWAPKKYLLKCQLMNRNQKMDKNSVTPPACFSLQQPSPLQSPSARIFNCALFLFAKQHFKSCHCFSQTGPPGQLATRGKADCRGTLPQAAAGPIFSTVFGGGGGGGLARLLTPHPGRPVHAVLHPLRPGHAAPPPAAVLGRRGGVRRYYLTCPPSLDNHHPSWPFA